MRSPAREWQHTVLTNKPVPVSPALQPEFSVLLGPDYAGKSSVLSALSLDGWRPVSYDHAFVEPECSLVDDLRDCFVTTALRGLGKAYSPDFVLTLLQTAVVYLRDQVLRAGPKQPVMVDSYYYKILAKCLLTDLVNEELFAWWRSFPQPQRVIYLDVDPETTWQRSDEGARLNQFEYYGATPTFEGFWEFQTDLRQLMVLELGAIPITVIHQPDSVGRVVNAVRRIARSDSAA